jgi:hypothetical protein
MLGSSGRQDGPDGGGPVPLDVYERKDHRCLRGRRRHAESDDLPPPLARLFRQNHVEPQATGGNLDDGEMGVRLCSQGDEVDHDKFGRRRRPPETRHKFTYDAHRRL